MSGGCGMLVFDRARLAVVREMCTIAARHGGQCVQILQGGRIIQADATDETHGRAPHSTNWHEDVDTLFEFSCGCGHAFAGSISVLRQDGWCPVCDEDSLKNAHSALLSASAGEDAPTLRRAIEAADAMQVDQHAVRRARTRLSDLLIEAQQQERCTELGAGPSVVSLPNEFLCPITHQRMAEPVVVSDGHTYERGAIEEVMRSTGVSPVSSPHASTPWQLVYTYPNACCTPMPPIAVAYVLTRPAFDPLTVCGGTQLTREPLSHMVFPNLALKSRIRSYHGDVQRIAELVDTCARADERQIQAALAKQARTMRLRTAAAALDDEVPLPVAEGGSTPDAPVGQRVTRLVAAGKRARGGTASGDGGRRGKSARGTAQPGPTSPSDTPVSLFPTPVLATHPCYRTAS